jgi:hypothetical protein
MKKIVLLAAALSVVLWSWGVVYAKGQGKGGGGKEARTVQAEQGERGKSRADDRAGKGDDSAAGETAEKGGGKGGSKEVSAERGRDSGKGEDAAKGSGKSKANAEEGEIGKGKAEKGGGKGRQMQNDALDKQLVHEQAKHQERVARLERILKLAQDSGDNKAVERVKGLMEKEQNRYDEKHQKMLGKGERIESRGDKAAGDETTAAGGTKGAKDAGETHRKVKDRSKGGDADKDENKDANEGK